MIPRRFPTDSPTIVAAPPNFGPKEPEEKGWGWAKCQGLGIDPQVLM